MDFQSFKNNCLDIFGRNDGLPPIDEDKLEKLFKLTKTMLAVNEKMNLTAITEERAVILKHYADSLTVSCYIPQNASVIDVGCGAGFPSLPLAIFRSDLHITALDGTAKRIDYVNRTAAGLGLDNINAISGRAEELGKDGNFREKYHVATARAVASLPILCELCLPFVKTGGKFVSMKALQGVDEAKGSETAAKLCGGKISSVDELSLTSDGENYEQRCIITVDKLSPTPQKYPRHYSQISKKPL